NLALSAPWGASLGAPANAVLTIVDDLPAPAPIHLAAAVASPTSITLRFNDNCANEVDFGLERSFDDGATWSDAVSVPASPGVGGVVVYTNTGLAPGAVYTYRVRARNPLANS